MLKQSPSRMKKILAILLVIHFIVSLTAVTAGAARRGGHRGGGHHGAVHHSGHHGAVHHGTVHRGGHHGVVHHGRVYYGYNNRPRAHYYLGQYYPSCDWAWKPNTNQWVWAC